MWFGMNGGLSCFDPEREVNHPPAMLRSFSASSRGELLSLSSATELQEGDALSVELEIDCFISSGAPQFRFRVQGPNANWSIPERASNAHLHFSSLPSGKFQIELQTRNTGGPWSETKALPPIEVRPQLSSTWWFRLLSIALGVVLVAGVTVLYFRGRQARRLRTELAEQTSILRETELRFERLFALNPSGQILVRPESGLIQQANASARTLLDQGAADLSGRLLSTCLTRIDLEVDALQLIGALESSSGETIFNLVRTNPSVKKLDLELRVARFPFGDDELALVTITDVTVKHALEEKLRQTQNLRAIGQLAGGLAHDFNNLLTTILGHVDLLDIETAPANQFPERLGEIRNAGLRGAALVRKLLAFGRQQLLQPEVIALGPAVAKVVKPLDDILGKQVKIEFDLDPNAGYVRADRNEIDRAVLNLCLNAREAMPRGGTVKITVRQATREEVENLAQPSSEQPDWLLLSVTDEGKGMSLEVRDRLFEPFFTTKENTGGTGLGLSTVHGIVSQSGGLMEVRSVEGRGTEMRIFLPAIRDVLTPAQPPVVRALELSTGLNVLLVDDQAEVRSTVSSLLKGMGNRVREAEDGIEALEVWKASPDSFDLVLTDIMMPRMDGTELGKEIERLSPGLPLIYMSGFLDHAVRRAECSFLAKPFSIRELQEALHSVCPVEQ
ncbi:MAG: two-component system cell cycle sensor histidine kinase/response regulator CckA [Planctomycetota bacterium]|jgi:two-component system cell cycle sensor histidine kinase/response regulator CckA